MICHAKDCENEAMPKNRFCGYHDELVEDGVQVRMKRSSYKPVSLLTDDQAEARRARKREQQRKYRSPSYEPLSQVKERARDAVHQVLDEIKAKRQERFGKAS